MVLAPLPLLYYDIPNDLNASRMPDAEVKISIFTGDVLKYNFRINTHTFAA